MKTRKATFLIPIFLVLFCLPSVAGAATTVSHDIAKDSIWTANKSPYRITTDIELKEGVSLKIEPGVVVQFYPEKSLEVKGDLRAVGTEAEPVVFTAYNDQPWGIISFTDFSDDAAYSETGEYVKGCILSHCIIEKGGGIFVRFGGPLISRCEIRNNVSSGIRVEFGGPRIVGNRIYANSTEGDPASGNGAGIIAYTDKNVTIADNIIYNNTSDGGRDGGGGIYAYAADNGKIDIVNNIIFGNTSSRFGGGIYAYKSLLDENTVINNKAVERGGGIYAVESEVRDNLVQANSAGRGGGIFSENAQITSNNIVRNSATRSEGGAIHYFGSGTIERNNILSNTAEGERACGAIYISGNPVIRDNNIIGNSGYALSVANVADAPDVIASGNFWGTTSEQAILDLTYDWIDNELSGLAVYNPYLSEPVEGTPLMPPCNVRTTQKEDGIELSWEEPEDSPSPGHRVYVGTESGYPYNKVIQTGPETSCVVSGLEPGREYYFAVTGFTSRDGREIESGLSEEVKVAYTTAAKSLETPKSVYPADKTLSSLHDVTLKASAPEGHAGVAAYRWQVFSAGDSPLQPIADALTSGRGMQEFRLEAKRLRPGQEYRWRVAACSASGNWSGWSEPASFSTEPSNASILCGRIASTLKIEKKRSPYFLTGNTIVMPEGELLIEPGVEIRCAPGSNLKIRGALIARGTPSDRITFTRDSSARWGNIIFADQSRDCKLGEGQTYLAGNVMENCIVKEGKGIVIESSSPLIKSCTIADNDGSGIVIRQGGPVIVGNDIYHNTAPTNGGGIYAYTNDIILVLSNKISENKADGDGGGVYAYGYMNTSTIHIEDNDISSNEATGDGGGIYLSRSSAVKNRVDSNTAKADGGGIYSTFGLVDGNKITGNRAQQGGGVFTEHNSSITRNYVSANEALSQFGGGAYINFWGMSIENETFAKNTVTGNRVPSNNDNGGVYVLGYLVFSENNIYGNTGSQLYNGNEAKSSPLVTENCYWGTTDKNSIEKKIIDGKDNPKLGQVTFEPFLAEPINVY